MLVNPSIILYSPPTNTAQELLGSEKKVRSKQYAPKKSKSLLIEDYQETSAALGEPYDKIKSCKFRTESYFLSENICLIYFL